MTADMLILNSKKTSSVVSIRPKQETTKSPFDIRGVKTKITTDDSMNAFSNIM